MENYVAFLPLRGGSKSIPLKNIRPFCGKPLAYWVIAAAEACAAIGKIFVATDSEEIRASLAAFPWRKTEIIGRGAATATDTASTESAMLEFAAAREFAHIVLLQATSPLLTASDLSRGIARYEAGKYDSLLSVVPQTRFLWEETAGAAQPRNYDPAARPRRQEMRPYFVENGAFYITRREALLQTKSRLSGRIGIAPMPEDTYFEIDEPADFAIMEELKKRRLAQEEEETLCQIL